jgi:ribosomal protein L17
MRHRKVGRKFGRTSAQRKSLFRNQTTALLKHGQIKTTLAKAKELRSYAEPVITLGRNHAWSKYEGFASELTSALTDMESAFSSASEEAQKAYAIVLESNSKVSNRFPSGLGLLIKVCKSVEGVSEQLVVLHKVRTAQMARQQAIGQATSMITATTFTGVLFEPWVHCCCMQRQPVRRVSPQELCYKVTNTRGEIVSKHGCGCKDLPECFFPCRCDKPLQPHPCLLTISPRVFVTL